MEMELIEILLGGGLLGPLQACREASNDAG